MGESRRQRLEAERAAMSPVPEMPYEHSEWKKGQPHPDCHVQVLKNYYSVPHQLRGKSIDVRITARHVEFFFDGERVAFHPLLSANLMGRYESVWGHFPPAQQFLLETLPRTLREKAHAVGAQTFDLVERLFALGNHPLRYMRRVQGIMGLLSDVKAAELEQAIETARMLGDDLPRPSILREIVRQSRTVLPEATPVERKPNRFVRGPKEIVAKREPEEGLLPNTDEEDGEWILALS